MTTTAAKPAAPRSLLDLTFAELEREFVASGLPPVHVRSLWRAVHRDLQMNPAEAPDLVPPLQRWLAENVGPGRPFFFKHLL